MLIKQNYILNTEEEYKQIDSVKDWIENVYESGSFFNLSLRTLELIRRFNNLYLKVYDKDEENPSDLNQLVITSKGLETEFIRSL